MKKDNCFVIFLICVISIITFNAKASIYTISNDAIFFTTPKNGVVLQQNDVDSVICNFYRVFIFGEQEFDSLQALRYCTPHLIYKLKEAYQSEYDGDGYAVWDMSVSQELDVSDEKLNLIPQIKSISPMNADWYKVVLDEYGYIGEIKLKMVYLDSKWMIDDYAWIKRM